jgi:hypothetical protein
MSFSPNSSQRPLPRWLMVACSVFAVGHLLAVGLLALEAQSGPWLAPPPIGGASMAEGPQFAKIISMNVTVPYYLEPLRMTHNYHFGTNRPANVAVYFEAHLKDEFGKVTVLKFPDDKANIWVRHRQEMLAQNLAQDQPMPPLANQRVAADGGELPKVEIWASEGPWTMRLKLVDELQVPRNQQVEQPSAWSKALAQSYMRYLCRQHKAVSAELIRYSRPTVMPAMLFLTEQPNIGDSFTELKSNFGEYRRE